MAVTFRHLPVNGTHQQDVASLPSQRLRILVQEGAAARFDVFVGWIDGLKCPVGTAISLVGVELSVINKVLHRSEAGHLPSVGHVLPNWRARVLVRRPSGVEREVLRAKSELDVSLARIGRKSRNLLEER